MSGNRQPGDMKHPVKSRYRHRHNPPSLIVPITKEMDDEKENSTVSALHCSYICRLNG
ncbi:hypothetical [Yersinia pestis KIM10+]|uniref:Uncharacterized protein n=1 Tax=Yersinia pestis TaxID=632 RepID=Q8CL34_YERPE|nr:hypothetical [Yersinia pestis KIM10+]